jgi:hypothetical protein
MDLHADGGKFHLEISTPSSGTYMPYSQGFILHLVFWIMNLAFNPRALKTQFETYVLKQMHNYLLLWFYSFQGIWETKLVSNHIMVFRTFCCFRISRVVSCNLLSIKANVLFILGSLVFFLFFLFLPLPQHNLQEDLLISNKLHNILNTCAFHQEEHLILLFWSNLEILSTI